MLTAVVKQFLEQQQGEVKKHAGRDVAQSDMCAVLGSKCKHRKTKCVSVRKGMKPRRVERV